jgi:hypothetical protein
VPAPLHEVTPCHNAELTLYPPLDELSSRTSEKMEVTRRWPPLSDQEYNDLPQRDTGGAILNFGRISAPHAIFGALLMSSSTVRDGARSILTGALTALPIVQSPPALLPLRPIEGVTWR